MISERKPLGRSCKQKNNLLHKDTKPKTRKQRTSLKCKTNVNAVKSCESAVDVQTDILSAVKPCEVRLKRINLSGTQKFDQPSKHERKPIKRKVSQVSHVIPIMSTNGTRQSLKSSVVLHSCQTSEKSLEKFATPQKQTNSQYKNKFNKKSAVISPNQVFSTTSTPLNKNARRKASQSSRISSVEPSYEIPRSSPKCSLQRSSRQNSKSSETLQSLTPVVKKAISEQESSTSYRKKQSKCTLKSSIISSSKFDSKISAASSGRDKSSTKSSKNHHARRKNLSDIPMTNLSLSDVSLQPRKAKSDNFRLPGRNTLKRKRYTIEALKKLDENYEDDIYEPQNFENFKDLLLSSPDANTSIVMSTPKLGFPMTPLIRHKTPKCTDFSNSASYAISRKVAEKCMYRKKKKKDVSVEIPVEPEKKKLEFSAIISEAIRVQKHIETMTEESDEENSYFSFCD